MLYNFIFNPRYPKICVNIIYILDSEIIYSLYDQLIGIITIRQNYKVYKCYTSSHIRYNKTKIHDV